MLAVLLLVLMSGPQDAPTAPQAVPEPAEHARADNGPTAAERERESRIVCRREAVTGSNRTRQVCERQGVIEHVRQQSQRWHDDILSNMGTPDCDTSPQHCATRRSD